MEKKAVLETQGLCKFFGGIKAVNNVDFKLYENEILGLVGDNGAGKSTLIKTISGLYKKDDGKYYVQFKKIVTESEKELDSVHSGNTNPIKLPGKLPYMTMLRIESQEESCCD